jgi:hypothetical protein
MQIPLPEKERLYLHSFRKARFCNSAGKFAGILILTLIAGRSTALAQANCEVSQSTFAADMQFMKQQHAPTHLRLMPSRYVELLRAARGLSCSGVALVAFDGLRYRPTASGVPLVAFDGLRYRPAAWADDPGLPFLVPELARVFRVSLVTATDVLLIGVVLLASGLGLRGFLGTVQTELGRRIGVVGFLILTIVELIAGDVYVMNAAPAIACVPWILSFVSRRKLTADMLITFCVTGLLGETANLFRAHAGTGLVLFTLVVAAGLYQIKPAARVLLVTILLVSAASPGLLFRELYARRNAFLEHQPGAMLESGRVHPFWHSIYIGLSYVKNSDVPGYSDEVAAAKVRLLRPEAVYTSPEYEQVLKGEVFKLAKRRPFLILANLFVKLGIVSFFCVCAANVGLYAATLARKPIWSELAFWLAITFNGLFGILVIPRPQYLLGLITFAALYGIYSIEYAAGQPHLQSRLRWIENLSFVG